MVTIDESNMVHCPHCEAELDAYKFDGFTQQALEDMGLCEGNTECPECNEPIFLEVTTYIKAEITVKKE